VNPAPSQRTRMSAALTVIGAVLLMCGVIMALVGEVMRLTQGELHGLVSGGVVVAILGLACGLGALVVAAGPSRQRGRFWSPGHPGYPVSPARLQAGYMQPWSEPPGQPGYSGLDAGPAYASPAYPQSADAEPVHAEPVHAEPGYAEPAYSEAAYSGPVYIEPPYAQPVYSEPVYAEPVYVPAQVQAEPVSMAPEQGGVLPPVRGPFDAYDRFAADQPDPSVRG
jgi:hypothetical protein